MTYATDKERMLALKTKCLLSKPDMRRVENEQTLKECFDRLDEEYGDINTLVADILLNWQNLKSPKTDQEFIKFVTSIENGVSCLRSLGHEKEVEFSFMAVTLENKLDDRMKKEFSVAYTIDESPDKERMKSLMKYLVQQKKAAHMRSCNYKTQTTKPKDDAVDPNTKSNSGIQGGGRGSGRGKARGARGRGSFRSDAEPQEEGQAGRGRGRGGFRG